MLNQQKKTTNNFPTLFTKYTYLTRTVRLNRCTNTFTRFLSKMSFNSSFSHQQKNDICSLIIIVTFIILILLIHIASVRFLVMKYEIFYSIFSDVTTSSSLSDSTGSNHTDSTTDPVLTQSQTQLNLNSIEANLLSSDHRQEKEPEDK